MSLVKISKMLLKIPGFLHDIYQLEHEYSLNLNITLSIKKMVMGFPLPCLALILKTKLKSPNDNGLGEFTTDRISEFGS